MTQAIALRIQELRTGAKTHSWRRISEIICDEFPEYVKEQGYDLEEIRGNQLHGKYDLCEEARQFLGIEWDSEEGKKWE